MRESSVGGHWQGGAFETKEQAIAGGNSRDNIRIEHSTFKTRLNKRHTSCHNRKSSLLLLLLLLYHSSKYRGFPRTQAMAIASGRTQNELCTCHLLD